MEETINSNKGLEIEKQFQELAEKAKKMYPEIQGYVDILNGYDPQIAVLNQFNELNNTFINSTLSNCTEGIYANLGTAC